MKLSKSLFIAVVMTITLIFTVQAAGPTGAIFTTTPDGGIVNENVHYNAKIEVYLDGGPGPNAPQAAAGLDDGLYVYQVTDPSGWVLLSMDPAKCRVIEVKDGIIQQLVSPDNQFLLDGITPNPIYGLGSTYELDKNTTVPCHIQDPPDGVAGPNGRHDTNIDVDHGTNGAIVVQLMPFLDTPNPGGVYKAWVTYFVTYKARGGDLMNVPGDKPNEIVKKKGVFQGYVNDPGFGPPRSDQKTDNFKVKEVPPYIKVYKYVDTNGNGQYDASEPSYDGWKITLTETLYDGTKITNTCYTPCERAVAPGSTVTVEEGSVTGWMFTYIYVDGVKPAAQGPSVDVNFASGDMSHTVKFGNFERGQVKACKYEDKDGDGGKDAPIAGWKVFLTESGIVVDDQITGTDGCYTWTDLGPLPDVSYDVEEETRDGWTATSPTEVEFTPGPPQSGFAYTADFTNFKNGQVKACKYEDKDGDGGKDTPIAGWKVFLTESGIVVDDQVTGTDGCYTWTDLGPLPDGYYDVEEETRDGWTATSPTEVEFTPGPPQSGFAYTADFTNFKNVEVTACKLKDYDGYMDTNDRVAVEGWKVFLTKNGAIIDTQYTGANGCYTWTDLGPIPDGYYDTEEETLDGWFALGAYDNDGVFHPGWTAVDFENPPQSSAKYKAVFVNTPAQGCTPGYWKVEQHWDSWPAPWSPDGALSAMFYGVLNVPYASHTVTWDQTSVLMSNATQVQALNFQGGDTVPEKAEILLRAAVAAILNADSPDVNYSWTSVQVIGAVNDALASKDITIILNLATQLDHSNNAPAGCPLH